MRFFFATLSFVYPPAPRASDTPGRPTRERHGSLSARGEGGGAVPLLHTYRLHPLECNTSTCNLSHTLHSRGVNNTSAFPSNTARGFSVSAMGYRVLSHAASAESQTAIAEPRLQMNPRYFLVYRGFSCLFRKTYIIIRAPPGASARPVQYSINLHSLE